MKDLSQNNHLLGISEKKASDTIEINRKYYAGY